MRTEQHTEHGVIMDTPDQIERRAILAALTTWINQRPGLDWAHYGGDGSAYRAEVRSIGRDLAEARILLRAVEWREASIPAAVLRDAFRAFSGRLSWHYCPHGQTGATTCGRCGKTWCGDCDGAPAALCHWCNGRGYSHAKPGRGRLKYATGQYWPTEYRKAACAVLASALWQAKRADMPETDETPGITMRQQFRREFGRGLAGRWFS